MRSAFDAAGTLKPGRRAALPPLNAEAEESYVRRYLDAFPKDCLKGRRIAVYQHSAVGRDTLVRIFKALGADAVPAGRSDTFIPIDTENITDEQLDRLEALAKEAGGPVEAVVSTDGDSDRPLLAAVDRAPDARGRRVRFYGGDLLGAVVSDFLAADLCITPVSAPTTRWNWIWRGAASAFLRPASVRPTSSRPWRNPRPGAAMRGSRDAAWHWVRARHGSGSDATADGEPARGPIVP